MKYVLLILAAIILLIVLVAIIGALLPRQHVAASRLRLKQTPEAVWAVLADRAGATSWRKDLKSVEKLEQRGGLEVWRETGAYGVMTLEVVESAPPGLLVTRIADPDLPFGGSWTYAIAPSPEGSTVTITENGEVKNPLFRFMARFVFGHNATLDAYLKALAGKFGENALPEHVP